MAAAAIIAIVDGSDVLGVFAANGMTMLAFGAAAVALPDRGDAAAGRRPARGRSVDATATAASSATGA